LSALFDESVLKAIERSNPLPPFPDSYRMSQDELQITFNLSDLEGR
jgi:colicin import membrane protein